MCHSAPSLEVHGDFLVKRKTSIVCLAGNPTSTTVAKVTSQHLQTTSTATTEIPENRHVMASCIVDCGCPALGAHDPVVAIKANPVVCQSQFYYKHLQSVPGGVMSVWWESTCLKTQRGTSLTISRSSSLPVLLTLERWKLYSKASYPGSYRNNSELEQYFLSKEMRSNWWDCIILDDEQW